MESCQNQNCGKFALESVYQSNSLLTTDNYKIITREETHIETDDDDVVIEVDSNYSLRVPQLQKTIISEEASIEETSVSRKRVRGTSENEEEIEMNLTRLFSGKLLRAHTRFVRKVSVTANVTEKAGGKDRKAKLIKKFPNHFVAIQVCDTEIIEKISAIQNCVVELEPRLKSALIALPTLHITLAVMHLASNEEIEKSLAAIEEACSSFHKTFSEDPLQLHFEDLSHFKNKVLYGCIQKNERLFHLAETLRARIKDSGVTLVDEDKFTPHLTVMKLSKDPRLFKKGMKQISPHLYEEFVKGRIGSQVVRSVQLLSMTDMKDTTGYYASRGEFKFIIEQAVEENLLMNQVLEERAEAREKMKTLISSVLTSTKV